jgi:hypothetical protein
MGNSCILTNSARLGHRKVCYSYIAPNLKTDIIEDMRELLESQKVYIDQDLWYIPNFLTEEEAAALKEHCDEPTGWYITSRSPSIRNKFIGVNYRLHAEGTVCPSRGIDLSLSAVFPTDEDEHYRDPIFWEDGGLLDRLSMALPNHLLKNTTLQSFWPFQEGFDNDGAFGWHHEKGNPGQKDDGMTGAWSLYLNDDFEGGQLLFKNKPEIVVKPQAGMLINIPITKEFTHKVTPVTSGIRHTLYGVCYEDKETHGEEYRNISTGDNC